MSVTRGNSSTADIQVKTQLTINGSAEAGFRTHLIHTDPDSEQIGLTTSISLIKNLTASEIQE